MIVLLLELHIENIAVIEKLDVAFDNGLNILTGETGAGKSIIIDSINLILGNRANNELIRSGQNKAVVEALFSISEEQCSVIEDISGIPPEYDNCFIVSRELLIEGRSICRLNGRMVTLSVLKQIANLFVNIHGQNDNQMLFDHANHIWLLDEYSRREISDVKKEYTSLLKEVRDTEVRIEELSANEIEKERKIDLLKYQLQEIDQAKLIKGEEEELNTRRIKCVNSEKLVNAISDAYETLYGGEKTEATAYNMLAQALNAFSTVSEFDERINKFASVIEEATINLKDLSHEVRKYRDELQYGFAPGILDEIEQRLDVINDLKRKYGNNINEILKYRDEIEYELQNITHHEERLNVLKGELKVKIEQLIELGETLYKIRVKMGKELQKKVENELKDLDMAKVKFEVSVVKQQWKENNPNFTNTGIDSVEFLISTDPAEPLKSLSKIASGGEMSRIMLAIKTVLAKVDNIGTLIFDEIDSGVSGKAAQKIAEKLFFLARNKQVMCITHLPQIASMADSHYLIKKNEKNSRYSTSVEKLNKDTRREELARIISGVKVTNLTLEHADELIKLSNDFKADRGKADRGTGTCLVREKEKHKGSAP